MNKESCALKLVDEIILYYDARSKKHQIKVIVVIKSKWYNLDYPCYPVGRPHITFPVTTKLYIP